MPNVWKFENILDYRAFSYVPKKKSQGKLDNISN